MTPLESFEDIFLYKGFVDFRKSIDGLHAIVNSESETDIFQPCLFVFTNRRKNKVKILYWDKTGFALWYKRLEKRQFKWPLKMEDDIVKLSQQQLEWILSGVDILKITPHQELFFKKN